MTDKFENFLTKIFLAVGAPSGYLGITLSDWDLIWAIVLKMVSVLSFSIIIVINLEKFCEKISKYFQRMKSFFKNERHPTKQKK